MKPEQINIAIAESIPLENITNFTPWHGETYKVYTNEEGLTRRLPDYHGDLNAMHEAIISLGGGLKQLYEEELESILYRDRTPGDYLYLSRATAPQRAEAYLRTIGKWVEDENMPNKFDSPARLE